MPWVKFDDHFDDDPDLIGMSTDAIALHICATTWSARHMTDGAIGSKVVAQLPGGGKKSVIRELTSGEKPWWEICDGGFRIRNFLKYNPSSKQVIEARNESAARVSRHRQKVRNGVSNADVTRYSRVTEPVTNTVTPPVTPPVTGSKEECNAVSNAVTPPVSNAVSNAAPVPVPLYIPPTPLSFALDDGPEPESSCDGGTGPDPFRDPSLNGRYTPAEIEDARQKSLAKLQARYDQKNLKNVAVLVDGRVPRIDRQGAEEFARQIVGRFPGTNPRHMTPAVERWVKAAATRTSKLFSSSKPVEDAIESATKWLQREIPEAVQEDADKASGVTERDKVKRKLEEIREALRQDAAKEGDGDR